MYSEFSGFYSLKRQKNKKKTEGNHDNNPGYRKEQMKLDYDTIECSYKVGSAHDDIVPWKSKQCFMINMTIIKEKLLKTYFFLVKHKRRPRP